MNSRALLFGIAAAAAFAAPALAAPPAKTAPATVTSPATQPVLSKSERMVTMIKSAQEKLKGMNLYSGPVDGKRNATFVKSVETFQRGHKIAVTGHLTTATEKALGI